MAAAELAWDLIVDDKASDAFEQVARAADRAAEAVKRLNDALNNLPRQIETRLEDRRTDEQ